MGSEKTQWKKGQSGNPSGQPKLPEDIKAARKLTTIEFERAVNKYLYQDKAAITKAAADPSTPVIELLITSILHKAVVLGDEKRLAFLLDRIIGKVKERMEIEVESAMRNLQELRGMSTEEIVKLAKRTTTSAEREIVITSKEPSEPETQS